MSVAKGKKRAPSSIRFVFTDQSGRPFGEALDAILAAGSAAQMRVATAIASTRPTENDR